jgi:hypothetical protein
VTILLGESTSYGFPKVIKSKIIILKIIWSIYFLIGSIVTVWFLLSSIMNYLDYEIVSRIQTLSEKSMLFPSISIFPHSSFKDSFTNRSLDKIIKILEMALRSPDHFRFFHITFLKRTLSYEFSLQFIENIFL